MPSPKKPNPKKPSGKKAGTDDPGPKDVKQIHAQIDRAGWEALRALAAKQSTSIEAMIVEALNHHLKRHKQPGVIERRLGKAADHPAVTPKNALTDPISGQVSLPLAAPG
ncbi:hypothetical protein [Methylobacterium sp. WL8]|uniref:hypothetical protein n=1 Tax=Methylobacterium sp. WL8 TaxID=2603899 RepID=UPI0011CB3312|nr:hypothetical protein [Methylobacterium sp. WL8]TXN77382.1 hypothetical protein FV234_23770 [Methylobacterium sp. WL8]